MTSDSPKSASASVTLTLEGRLWVVVDRTMLLLLEKLYTLLPKQIRQISLV
jgi:hypothetical protein